MQTKFKIVETEDYILAVSNEGPETGDLFLHKTNRDCSIHLCIDRPAKQNVIGDDNVDYFLGNCKKIAGYKPKNNTPELALPLLPEIVVQDDVEKLAKEKSKEVFGNDFSLAALNYQTVFKEAYKAATKIYSEEDLEKVMELCIKRKLNKLSEIPYYKNSFIQSLKQPTPKYFIGEIESRVKPNGINELMKEEFYQKSPEELPNCVFEDVLKTTTIGGKEYLVGKYSNE